MKCSDDELMVAYQNGDESAFEVISNRYSRKLVSWVNLQVHDWQMAEDIAQDSLLSASLRSSRYVPAGKFTSWLFRIVRNKLTDAVRKRNCDCLGHVTDCTTQVGYETRSDVSHACSREIDAVDQVASSEAVTLIRKLADSIPQDQSVTLDLFCQGYSLTQIAEASDAALPTVKSRLRLAREKIREKIGRM